MYCFCSPSYDDRQGLPSQPHASSDATIPHSNLFVAQHQKNFANRYKRPSGDRETIRSGLSVSAVQGNTTCVLESEPPRFHVRRFGKPTVDNQLLNSKDAATALGLSVSTLYSWLMQSDAGAFEIRGQPVTICYYQGGRRGQGRIRIGQSEIERLLSLMRVSPRPNPLRKKPMKKPALQHITARLGRPDD